MSDVLIHTELNRGGEIVTTVIGELDANTAPMLAAKRRGAPVATDVFDLRFVSFMSAAGISTLIEAHRVQPCRVVGSVAVTELFEICELTETFAVSDPVGPPWLHRARFGVGVHDASLSYLYVNDALGDINGLPAQAHYGQHPTDLFSVDTDELSPILEGVIRTGRDQRIVVRGATPTRHDGAWDCQYRLARYRRNDVIVDVIVATVDTDVPDNNELVEPTVRLEFDRPHRLHA